MGFGFYPYDPMQASNLEEADAVAATGHEEALEWQ